MGFPGMITFVPWVTDRITLNYQENQQYYEREEKM